jgi:hypothetical protein
MYLIGLQALNHEHVILAKLTRFLAPRRPITCRVDCLYYDSKSFARGDVEEAIKALRNPDGTAIWRRETAKPAPAALPRPSFVGEAVQEIAESLKELPFRLKEVVPQRSRWRCHLAQIYLPEEEDPRPPLFDIGAWSAERKFAYPRPWLVKREEPGLGCGTGDSFQDEAVAAPLRMRGGVVVGRGGTARARSSAAWWPP